MLKYLLTGRSVLSVSRLEEIARQTQLTVRRSRKFSATHFLLSLLQAVCNGQASFNQLAIKFHQNGAVPMSRQALWKRIGKEAVAFLIQVIADQLEEHSQESLKGCHRTKFRRVLIEDSSIFRMPKANAESFPAHGNASGSTAGVKCDLCYDILSSSAVSFGLYRATEQDRTIGKEVLAHAKKGDLILRDMGYFDLSEFAYLEGIGAFWLTRLPLSTDLVAKTSQGEDTLESFLKNESGDRIDTMVLVGGVRHRCRLIALRAKKEVAEKRRRERRAKAKAAGKTPSKKALIRDGWHLMVTNVLDDKLSAEELGDLYRTRWAIEIQFRAWKQSTHLAAGLNRRSNQDHLEALVCASMIIALMGLRQIALFADKTGRCSLSPEKIMDWLTELIPKARGLGELFTKPPDPRHIKRDSRKRKSTVYEGLIALS